MVHSFETAGPITIDMRNDGGRVELNLVETTTTTVDVTAGEDPSRPWLTELWGAFGQGGAAPFGEPSIDRSITEWTPRDGAEGNAGRLYVDTRPAAGWRSRIDVRITAPESSEVTITGRATDVRITGMAGALTIRTSSGEVSTQACSGDARMTTASGDLQLGAIAGNAFVQTAAGDIRIRAIGGRGSVQSTSGDVHIGPVGGDAEVRTVSGDVTVAEVRRGAVRITTVSGDVDLALRRGTLATIGLTSVSGSVRSDLSVEPARPAGRPDAERPTAAAHLRVKTVSGDIRLRRAEGADHAGGDSAGGDSAGGDHAGGDPAGDNPAGATA